MLDALIIEINNTAPSYLVNALVLAMNRDIQNRALENFISKIKPTFI